MQLIVLIYLKLVAFTFVFTLIFYFRWFPRIYNSIASKWYQSLDNKNASNVFSLRVKFNGGFSFGEMRRLYSIKIKKANAHRQRKNKVGKSSWKFQLLSKELSMWIVWFKDLKHNMKKNWQSYCIHWKTKIKK